MKRFLDSTAKVIRVLSAPPFMIISLLLILYFNVQGFFCSPWSLIIVIVFLGILPVLPYFVCRLLPELRKYGREKERRVVIGVSLLSYALSVAASILLKMGSKVYLVCCTYFLSVLFIGIFNFVFKKRASGHACSVTGPALFLLFFIGWKAFLACAVYIILVFWSSLRLKKHTFTDLITGASICMASFIINFIIYLYFI